MKKPEIPQNETQRLESLCSLNVLDTAGEERFDRLTRIAQQYFNVGIALVSLVDADRQWFKSRQGLDATETPRDISFCGHAILDDNIFYIPNALEDPRFVDNPLVTGPPNIRFYTGAPLHAPDGERVGTLCIIDDKPHELSMDELALLRDLADSVEAELERTHLLQIQQALIAQQQRLEQILEVSPGVLYTCRASGDFGATFVSPQVVELMGYSAESFTEDSAFWLTHVHPEDRECILDGLQKLFQDEHEHEYEYRFLHANGEYYWMHDKLKLVRDLNGEPQELVGLWMDITERKRAEQDLQFSNAVLDAVNHAQSQFISQENSTDIFSNLLQAILDLSGSEYGFIGEIFYTENNLPYLKTHGITNIAWNDETQKFYEENAPEGLEFHNLESLFGYVITQRELVISNAPENDERSGGLPEGHPALNCFMGIPLLDGETIVGMIGIANRESGYDDSVLSLLQPLITASKNIIGSLKLEQRRYTIERTLKESEARIRAIVDTVVDGIVTIDHQGLIQTFNPAAENIFGYKADEVIDRNVKILMPAPYTQEHDGYLHNYLSTGEKKVIGIGREVTGKRKDGSIFPMELSVSEMQINEARMFTGIVRDITERKRQESDIQTRENRIRAIVDTVVDGIVTIDKDGLVQTFNPAAEHIFGYQAEQVIGQNVKILMPTSYAQEHDGYLHNYLTTGEKKVIGLGREVVGQRKDGSTFPMELSVSEMEIDGERMFTGIVRDITERKKVERMKSEFISTVSHELRTPLTSIRGALGLVLGKASDLLPAKMLKMLEMANRNSERLTLLINDILDLEKIESGRLEFEFKSIDLVELAHQAIADNEGYASQHHASLVLKTELEQAPVMGDAHRLLQVFANLISNAVKYSPEDDSVEIAVTTHESGFRVTVRDNGLGIPEEFRSSIFQRFAQADSSDTREKGGTGLGLSITKAIIERHDGNINYESEQGKGTEFYFDLPHMPSAQPVQPAIIERSESMTPAQVLICEDNPDVAEILAEMLNEENLQSDIAMTAEAARSLIAKNTYLLMLLDLNLPDMDGLQFLKELRALPATMELPIIVISGRATEGRADFTGDAVMVVDWIQKPVDREQLERAMQEALRRKIRPHILHVEDDLDIIQVTQALLDDVADISHSATVQGSRELLDKEEFDLVILDLGLEDGSGLELLDELKGRCPIIIFSAQNPDREISTQVTAALTKSMTSNEQLLATIKDALKGKLK